MALIKCSDCSAEISDRAASCPGCGRPHYTPVGPKVTVGDISMSFGAMVNFMVKWAIAAIPALLILFLLGGFLAGMVGVIFKS